MTNGKQNAPATSSFHGQRRLLQIDARSLGLFRIVAALLMGALFIAPAGFVPGLASDDGRAGLDHPHLAVAARVLGTLGALALLKGWRSPWALVSVIAALVGWGAAARQFAALNGGVFVAMLASMFLVPVAARFSIDSLLNAMRRGVRLDRRPASGTPAATTLCASPRTILFSIIIGAGALWTTLHWAAARSERPDGAGSNVLLLVPLATLVLLLGARQWNAAARAALRPARAAWVYYDDSCGFCFRCCQWVALADGAGRLTFIGASDRAAHLHAIPAADLATSVVVVDAVSGAVLRQARAAAAMVRALPAPYHPLRIMAWPGAVWFADRAYDFVARNRHRISLWMGAPACGIDGRPTGAGPDPKDEGRARREPREPTRARP